MSSPRKSKANDPDPNAPGLVCEMPGCALPGDYRAPRSRSDLNHFRWFCLEHVREYNAAWDYYKGMSPEQIEAQLRADSSWQRPSWPLGKLGHHARVDAALEDELHAFAFAPRAKPAPPPGAPPELREPLGVLGLAWPVTMEVVKARYKELAKRHHPDANGGDKAAEETLKTINLAYAALRGRLGGRPVQAAGQSGA